MFELIDAKSHGTLPSHANSNGIKLGSGRQQALAQVLICETSKELRNYSELFVEPVLLGEDGVPLPEPEAGTEDQEGGESVYLFCFCVDTAKGEAGGCVTCVSIIIILYSSMHNILSLHYIQATQRIAAASGRFSPIPGSTENSTSLRDISTKSSIISSFMRESRSIPQRDALVKSRAFLLFLDLQNLLLRELKSHIF